MPSFEPAHIAGLAGSAFFAILFLQSGIDKVADREGNLGWMEPHFARSPLKGLVPLLLSVLTMFELGSGLLCAGACAFLLFPLAGFAWLPTAAMAAVLATLLMLFLGQRLAKDYVGAASLAAYFAAALLTLIALPWTPAP